MNSYALADKLRKTRRKHTLSAGAQALYYELVAINNEEKWPDVFRCRNGELESALNISEKTLGTYRDELICAGLIDYLSGKNKKIPGSYSLNGTKIGGKIYHQAEHRTEHPRDNQPSVETPDNNKEETKTERETETYSSSSSPERAAEIENAIQTYFEPPQKKEEEKSSAKKEEVPTAEEADDYFQKNYMTLYRDIMEKNEIAGTPEKRLEMLKEFWIGQIDFYSTRFPPWADIIKHFRNWVPEYAKVKQGRQQQTKITNGNTYKPTSRTRTREPAKGGYGKL